MDVIFGSEGVAVTDHERQAEISREIGLDAALARLGQGIGHGEEGPGVDVSNEKAASSEKGSLKAQEQ
jgi:hypothetical protein